MSEFDIPMTGQRLASIDVAAQRGVPPSSIAIEPYVATPAGEAAAHTYKMASDVEQSKLDLQNQRDAANDKLIMDQYERSSPDKSFLTPESVESAMKELKGKLSRTGMNNLEQLYETRKMNSIKMKDEMSKLNSDKLVENADQYEFNARYLYQPLLDTYNTTLKNTGNKLQASQAFTASLQATTKMAAQLKKSDGTPAFPPDALRAFSQATPEKIESVIASTKYRADKTKDELAKRKGEAEVTKEEAQAEEAKAKAGFYKKGGAAGAGVSPGMTEDAIDAAAARYNLTGTLPTFGMGVSGKADKEAVLNRAAAIAKESGKTAEEQAIGQASAKTQLSALGQLRAQKAKILTFEGTAIKNADIALQESEKVDRTGSPALNRWINAGKVKIAGDVGVARLNNAMMTLANEYAKVMSSATGAGVTSDTARKEAQEMINSAQTPEQVRGVIDLMKKEMANRRKSYDEEEQVMLDSMKSGKKEEKSDTGKKGDDFSHLWK